LVEYPRPGVWAIAFVTGALGSEVKAHFAGEEMLSVFIPTTPNPTTGWYAIVPEKQVINLAMPIEDAFKVVISGGIVSPDAAALTPVSASPKRVLESLMEAPLQPAVVEED
jgi:uncharacterized membrane protein